MYKRVDVSKLKAFVLKDFPRDWVLKDIVLSEPDKMPALEFCAKVDVWLKLAREMVREGGGNR